MVIAENTLSGSFSPDSSRTTLESFSPAAGTLYYVEKVVFHSDGGGSDTAIYGNAGVFNNGISTFVYNYTNGKPSGSVTIDGSQISSYSVALGAYLTSSETLYVGDDNTTSDAATIYYTVHLRRVL